MKKSLFFFMICFIGQAVVGGNICCSDQNNKQNNVNLKVARTQPVCIDSQQIPFQSIRPEYAAIFITAEGDVEGAELLKNDSLEKVDFENYKRGTSEWQELIAYYAEKSNL